MNLSTDDESERIQDKETGLSMQALTRINLERVRGDAASPADFMCGAPIDVLTEEKGQ
jgi:hypothetical protein